MPATKMYIKDVNMCHMKINLNFWIKLMEKLEGIW